ncbi:hypothetical protein AB5N19_12038 [Seiridium cardinale]|uniref:Uncharacterized protein n=1 Tax=Seiridium cardinale TaxID=138064 RepID=A0ABR2XQH8_9PEZI
MSTYRAPTAEAQSDTDGSFDTTRTTTSDTLSESEIPIRVIRFRRLPGMEDNQSTNSQDQSIGEELHRSASIDNAFMDNNPGSGYAYRGEEDLPNRGILKGTSSASATRSKRGMLSMSGAAANDGPHDMTHSSRPRRGNDRGAIVERYGDSPRDNPKEVRFPPQALPPPRIIGGIARSDTHGAPAHVRPAMSPGDIERIRDDAYRAGAADARVGYFDDPGPLHPTIRPRHVSFDRDTRDRVIDRDVLVEPIYTDGFTDDEYDDIASLQDWSGDDRLDREKDYLRRVEDTPVMIERARERLDRSLYLPPSRRGFEYRERGNEGYRPSRPLGEAVPYGYWKPNVSNTVPRSESIRREREFGSGRPSGDGYVYGGHWVNPRTSSIGAVVPDELDGQISSMGAELAKLRKEREKLKIQVAKFEAEKEKDQIVNRSKRNEEESRKEADMATWKRIHQENQELERRKYKQKLARVEESLLERFEENRKAKERSQKAEKDNIEEIQREVRAKIKQEMRDEQERKVAEETRQTRVEMEIRERIRAEKIAEEQMLERDEKRRRDIERRVASEFQQKQLEESRRQKEWMENKILGAVNNAVRLGRLRYGSKPQKQPRRQLEDRDHFPSDLESDPNTDAEDYPPSFGEDDGPSPHRRPRQYGARHRGGHQIAVQPKLLEPSPESREEPRSSPTPVTPVIGDSRLSQPSTSIKQSSMKSRQTPSTRQRNPSNAGELPAVSSPRGSVARIDDFQQLMPGEPRNLLHRVSSSLSSDILQEEDQLLETTGYDTVDGVPDAVQGDRGFVIRGQHTQPEKIPTPRQGRETPKANKSEAGSAHVRTIPKDPMPASDVIERGNKKQQFARTANNVVSQDGAGRDNMNLQVLNKTQSRQSSRNDTRKGAALRRSPGEVRSQQTVPIKPTGGGQTSNGTSNQTGNIILHNSAAVLKRQPVSTEAPEYKSIIPEAQGAGYKSQIQSIARYREPHIPEMEIERMAMAQMNKGRAKSPVTGFLTYPPEMTVEEADLEESFASEPRSPNRSTVPPEVPEPPHKLDLDYMAYIEDGYEDSLDERHRTYHGRYQISPAELNGSDHRLLEMAKGDEITPLATMQVVTVQTGTPAVQTEYSSSAARNKLRRQERFMRHSR